MRVQLVLAPGQLLVLPDPFTVDRIGVSLPADATKKTVEWLTATSFTVFGGEGLPDRRVIEGPSRMLAVFPSFTAIPVPITVEGCLTLQLKYHGANWTGIPVTKLPPAAMPQFVLDGVFRPVTVSALGGIFTVLA